MIKGNTLNYIKKVKFYKQLLFFTSFEIKNSFYRSECYWIENLQ